MKKKVNLPRKVLKGIKNQHAIIVERLVIHQTNARAMDKKNSMESVTTAINMVTKLMNARRNLNLKVNATNVEGMVTTSEWRSKSFNPTEQLVKVIFGWDYNT